MMKKMNYWVLAALFLCSVCVFISCKDGNEDNPAVDPSENSSVDPSGDVKRDRARYTVMVYGNAGGQMDMFIEGVWDEIKPMLDDSTNVRVFVMYKYGKDKGFSGKYGQPNDLMQFELTSKTDLTKLHETAAVEVPEYELYDSKALAGYIKAVTECAPADNYIFVLWGHGGGYDLINDRPDNMVVTRAMLYDETLNNQALNMYQFADALATCGNTHFQFIMFHNCLMGNIETLTEVQQYADYFFVSSHSLASAGQPVTVMIDKLKKSTDYNFEDRSKEMFVDLKRIFTAREGMPKEMAGAMDECDVDIKIIRSNDLTNLNNNISFFINRLLELYPNLSPQVMQQAMTACTYVYEVDGVPYLIDLKHYLQTVAAAINDPELSAHAKNAIECIDHSVVERWDEPKSFSKLKEYYLSVVLPYHNFLHYVTRNNYTVAESYYPSAFNRRTGWALWMDANTYFPTQWQFNMATPADADMTEDVFMQYIDELNKK